MARPGLAKAVAHARRLLATELDPSLAYHSLAHTAEEVVPAVRMLAEDEGVTGRDAELLEVAAWFHDVGYTVQAEGHEAIGAETAVAVLTACGVIAEEVLVVRDLILATRMPQQPRTHLQRILCDADLSNLGQPAFFDRSDDLRRERAAAGQVLGEEEWLASQVAFLSAHRYWTEAARRRWGPGERANLARLRALLGDGAGAHTEHG